MLACVLMLKTCIKMYLKQSIYQHIIVYIYNVSMTKMVNNKTQDKPWISKLKTMGFFSF